MQKKPVEAMEKAKEAVKRDAALRKLRDSVASGTYPGMTPGAPLPVPSVYISAEHADMYSANAQFVLAECSIASNRYDEAIHIYEMLSQNLVYADSARLRICLGNTYYTIKNYNQALKCYRLAHDKLPEACLHDRVRMLNNIALVRDDDGGGDVQVHIKRGHINEAIAVYNDMMMLKPHHETAQNLIICMYIMEDFDGAKKEFSRLSNIPPITDHDDGDDDVLGAAATSSSTSGPTPGEGASEEQILEFLGDLLKTTDIKRLGSRTLSNPTETKKQGLDELSMLLSSRQKDLERSIIITAKLIAPAISPQEDEGYDYVINVVKKCPHAHLAADLELAKALGLMRAKSVDKALTTLQGYAAAQKQSAITVASRDGGVLVGAPDRYSCETANVNLSFFYMLMENYDAAEKCAVTALRVCVVMVVVVVMVQLNRNNAKALVNLGNIYFRRRQSRPAEKCYLAALDIETDLPQSLFNLGMNIDVDLYYLRYYVPQGWPI